jgi:hypothetical protein
MRYKINWIEKRVGRSGKEYMVMSLVDETGKETTEVSTFEMQYTLAQEIEGQIVQNGKFLNWKPKLEAPDFIKKGNGNFKAQQIEKVMERKEGSISKFQDNKELGIKVASTMNKAIDLAIAELGEKVMPEDILRWRKWIWNNWDVELTDTDAITGKLN